MMKSIKLTLITLSCLFMSCSQADAPRSNAAVTTEVALSDVPQSVKDVVKAARADFQMSEVLKRCVMAGFIMMLKGNCRVMWKSNLMY